jgi:hypothetical protein
MLVAHAHPVPASARPGYSLNGFWLRVSAAAFAAAEWLTQSLCGLSGHNLAFHFEENHVSLHCLNCGHVTPGWTVGRARVTRRT